MLLTGIWSCASRSESDPIAIFVAASGHDAGSGRKDAPFRSLRRALEELQRLRSQNMGKQREVWIRVAAGDYELGEGLVMGPEHCGDPGVATRILGEGARLLGSLSLASASPRREGGLLVFDLSALDARVLDPILPRGMGRPEKPVSPELFDAAGRMQRARWPNEGYARYGRVLDKGSVPRNRAVDIPLEKRERGTDRGGRFVFDNDRLDRWAKEKELWALGYWCWDWAEELLPIAEVDTKTRSILLGLPHRYGLKKGGTFYVTNAKCELDQPGEYHLDRAAKRLYVMARSDDDRGYRLSILKSPLLRMDKVHDCELAGLRFGSTRGGAIEIQEGRDIRIDGCEFRDTGLGGIRARGEGIRITDCLLERIGAAGVSISGGERKTLRHSRNEVAHCEIRHFGQLFRTYRPGIAIGGVGAHIHGNHIHEAPHSGIIFSGNEHVIELNEIDHVLLETGDCGAIYTGRDWTLFGTVIRNNYIHDLPGTQNRWQNGIYLDDMASGIRVEGNVFYRCNSGMLVGGGRHLTIRGNVFVDSKIGIRFDARGVGWMARHIADPKTSTLHKRLAAIPIDHEPWASRYPMLKEYLSDRFGRPVGSKVIGNAFFHTRFGKVADRDCVEVRDNLVRDQTLDLRSPDDESFRKDVLVIPEIEGFSAIPLHAIGSRGRRVPR